MSPSLPLQTHRALSRVAFICSKSRGEMSDLGCYHGLLTHIHSSFFPVCREQAEVNNSLGDAAGTCFGSFGFLTGGPVKTVYGSPHVAWCFSDGPGIFQTVLGISWSETLSLRSQHKSPLSVIRVWLSFWISNLALPGLGLLLLLLSVIVLWVQPCLAEISPDFLSWLWLWFVS